MNKHSKLWLGFLSSGLLAAFCAPSIAGDFPNGSNTASSTVASTVAKEQAQKKQAKSTPSSRGAVASLSDSTGIPQSELRSSLVDSKQPESLTASPAATMAAPMGFGADYGQAFVGLAGVSRDPSSHSPDGALAWGFGVGDANRYVGATLGFAIESLNPKDGGIGRDGAINLAITRNLPWMSAVSVGATRLASWGGAGMSRTPSYYGSFSKVFLLHPDNASNPMPLTFTLGLGNGYFRKIHDQNIGKDSIGYFGAVALQFHPQASVVVDYTGSVLTPGVSVVPVTSLPLTMSLGLYDVNQQYSNRTSFVASIGYAFNY